MVFGRGRVILTYAQAGNQPRAGCSCFFFSAEKYGVENERKPPMKSGHQPTKPHGRRSSSDHRARELPPVERWWLRLAPPRDAPSELCWPIASNPGARPAPRRTAAQLRGDRATARLGPPGVCPCLLAAWAGGVARTRRIQGPDGPRNAPCTPARAPVATRSLYGALAAEAIGGSERPMASLVVHSHAPGLLFRERCRSSVPSTGLPNPTRLGAEPPSLRHATHGLWLIIYNI